MRPAPNTTPKLTSLDAVIEDRLQRLWDWIGSHFPERPSARRTLDNVLKYPPSEVALGGDLNKD